jgi:hypothetical protein
MNKYRFGSTPAAIHLAYVVEEHPKSVGRKVSTSLSEFRNILKQININLNDTVFKLAMSALDTSTDLCIPEKVETLMRNVKVTEKKMKEQARQYQSIRYDENQHFKESYWAQWDNFFKNYSPSSSVKGR